MAVQAALANHHIVSRILLSLSDMKYKDRRQYGPDQPVEFLEFRPTLVPAILVNKLWAEEGTSILWRRYPHLPALEHMTPERRQYYTNKVRCVFLSSPQSESTETSEYLDCLSWPNLKSLEIEVDLKKHSAPLINMLHDQLERVDLSGTQSGGSKYFTETILPMIFGPCKNLRSVRIGPDTIVDHDPIHVSALYEHIDSCSSITTIEVKSANFTDKDALFIRLSQREGIEALEIDLDPGVSLLPFLTGSNALSAPFASLKRASIMCYPEIALELPGHLQNIEELQLDIARIPSSSPQPSDFSILDEVIAQLSRCNKLRSLKIGIGLVALDFPSSTLFPKLSGSSLVRLAKTCPELEDINLLAISGIDGSTISGEEFDNFCRLLPHLRSLNLKFQPTTGTALQTTALQSLGQHCSMLEILRLRLALQLPSLPVTQSVPHILVSSDETMPELPGQEDVQPLFQKLTHLAFCRPDTPLAPIAESFSSSISSDSILSVDPGLEAELVRKWAHPLLEHFPHLDILEAWGDFSGHDTESLNYFLPTQEILASTWEFLSSIEQDLWETDEDSFEEEDSWNSLEDWERASLMNEFLIEEEGGYIDDIGMNMTKLAVYDDESEGMITPGKTADLDEYFEGQPSR